MKYYLLGPAEICTGDIINMYNAAQVELERNGHEVYNIMYHGGWHEEGVKKAASVRLLNLLRCDGVFVLPDWQTDIIAELEFITAVKTNMQMVFANGVPKPHHVTIITH